MRSIQLRFTNADGEQLAATLDMPIDGKPRAYALLAHGFTLTRKLKANVHINRALTTKGIAVLRFDFTGLADSGGDFADTTFSSNVDDIVAAARFLEEHYQAPSILIGHSLGGAAMLVAARRIPSAVAVSTIAAPCDPAHLRHLFADREEEIVEKGETEIVLGGRRFTITRRFLDDISDAETRSATEQLGKALLIFHSPADEVVDIAHAGRIYRAAKHPKSFISLDRADHLLSDERDARYVGSVIASWADKYLPLEEERLTTNGYQVVVRTGTEGYFTEVRAGRHALTSDEPVSSGGSGLGPGPYALLLASLGSCTGMTLRMYADRKGWPLEEVNVYLSHDRVHAEDCADCSDKGARIDHIERVIDVRGALDEKQRQRLLEIADRCPVHRTLHGKIEVRTTLKMDDAGENREHA